MRSLLKELKDSGNIILYTDFRTGAIYDIMKNNTFTSWQDILLDNKGLTFSGLTSENLVLNSDITLNYCSYLFKDLVVINTPIYGNQYSYGGSSSFILYVTTAGKLQIRDNVGFSTATTNSINFNEKMDIFIVRDLTTVYFYINGIFFESQPLALNTMTISRFFIGGSTTSLYRATGSLGAIVIFSKTLTATEVAQLTSELEASSPEQAVSSKAVDHLNGYQFNGVDTYGDISLQFSDTVDWSIEYYWKFGDTGVQCLFSTTNNYMMLLSAGDIGFYFLLNTKTNNATFSSAFEKNTTYKINATYSKDTKIVTITRLNLITNIEDDVYADLTTSGSWSFDMVYLGKYYNNLYFLNGSIYDLKVNINGVTNNIIKTVTMNTPLQDFIDIPTVNFKGEMHALANERTQTSENLENTPLKILSGSFKINTETYDNREIREIECVTNGHISLPIQSLCGHNPSNSELVYHYYKQDSSTARLYFMADRQNPLYYYAEGYYLEISNTETISLIKSNIGSSSSLFATDINAFPIEEYVKISIKRESTGSFSIYINDTLLVVTTGSNPVTDTSYYNMMFSHWDIDAGDKLIYASENPKHSLYNKES